MNIANKLTILRIILVPVFLVCLLLEFPYHNLLALFIFTIASVTDAVDGHIARKYNMITDFGKLLDPLADKVLVIAALIAFTDLGIFGCIIPIIVISRELLVTSVRLVAVNSGEVIPASIWGKLKTITQLIGIIILLLALTLGDFSIKVDVVKIIGVVIMWISTVLTVVSGADYMKAHWKYIDHRK